MNRNSKIIPNDTSILPKENVLQWAQNFENVVFLESNKDTQAEQEKYGEIEAVLAVGAHQTLSCEADNAFEKLKDFRKKHKDYLFGYFSYDLKNDTEELRSENPDHLEFPALYFFQPKKVILWKNNQVEFLYLDAYSKEIEQDIRAIKEVHFSPKNSRTKCDIIPRLSKEGYYEKVSSILKHIHRGDIYEVNYCQEFYAENCEIHTIDVYQKLNQISQAPFASYIKLQDKFLLCASPERFVKKQNNKIIVQPIKGTARRLANRMEDERLAKSLADDPKERAENIMIVDLIRNDLSKNAKKGSVKVEELCKVYSFKQVHQLISTVVCEVDKDENDIDIIKSLFPMGSMTGAPKISAMEIIEEEEITKRGLYSGAVGYFSPVGNFDFNVVIRSILYNASKKYASFSVGSAITSLSVIENEYEECLIKAKALKEALSS
ncbi:anthranilate synthase component I family protein [Lutimonas sp.]|uniref:anthranilate synthase component I family protein n=1 Tax=Lutimonas sp. TaxID=1872403 RepID=UPI003D9AF7F1